MSVEVNETYNWIILECNNTEIEELLGTSWESEFGLPDNPTLMEKMKMNITSNIIKNETHWQTGYDLWDWTPLREDFGISPILSDELEFRKDPLNYTHLERLPNEMPLIVPYPAEIYFSFIDLGENEEPDYDISFIEATNYTYISYYDYVNGQDIYVDATYNEQGILMSLRIDMGEGSNETTFQMIQYREGPKASYIDVDEGDIFDYGVYQCPYNTPDGGYIFSDVPDRVRVGVELIGAEFTGANYSLIIYNMTMLVDGEYTNPIYMVSQLFRDNNSQLAYSGAIVYGAIMGGYFVSTTTDWEFLAQELNDRFASLSYYYDYYFTALSNGIKMNYSSEGHSMEFIQQYNASGVLEVSEYKIDGKEFLSYRLNDFDYEIPGNLVPFEVLDPEDGNTYGNEAPTLTIELGFPKERLSKMWYTLDGGITNITFTENTTISQDEWNKFTSDGPVTLEVYVNNTIGRINSTLLTINKLIDTPIITINEPSPTPYYGLVAPHFNISISGTGWEDLWYNLNDGNNITASNLIEQLNSTEWEKITSSSLVEVNFFANNSVGNIGTASVSITKDAEYPTVEITSPINGHRVDAIPPSVDVTVSDDIGLAERWYSIQEDSEHENVSFSGSNFSINQTLWDRIPEGFVQIWVYAQDYGANVNSTYIIVKKVIPPNITINKPTSSQYCGINPPYFNLTISESDWEVVWYNLNGGSNITASSLIEQVNSTEWEKFTSSGEIILNFYANDSNGYIGNTSIMIVKDAVKPNLKINSPANSASFEDIPPVIEATVSDDIGIAERWYSIQEDSKNENITFSSSPFDIDQTLWDRIPKGNVHIWVYARDYGGNLNSTYVIVQKTIEAPTDDDDDDDGDDTPDISQEIPGPNVYWLMMISSITLLAIALKLQRRI